MKLRRRPNVNAYFQNLFFSNGGRRDRSLHQISAMTTNNTKSIQKKLVRDIEPAAEIKKKSWEIFQRREKKASTVVKKTCREKKNVV